MPFEIKVSVPGIDPSTRMRLRELLGKRIEECTYGDVRSIRAIFAKMGSLEKDPRWKEFVTQFQRYVDQIRNIISDSPGRNPMELVAGEEPIPPAARETFEAMRTLVRSRPELRLADRDDHGHAV
jgi:hypothetical protein